MKRPKAMFSSIPFLGIQLSFIFFLIVGSIAEGTGEDARDQAGGIFVSKTCLKSAFNQQTFKSAILGASMFSISALQAVLTRTSGVSDFEQYFDPVFGRKIATYLQTSLDSTRHQGMRVRIRCEACSSQKDQPLVVAKLGQRGDREIAICNRFSVESQEAARKNNIRPCDGISGRAMFAALLFFASDGQILPSMNKVWKIGGMNEDERSLLTENQFCRAAAENRVWNSETNIALKPIQAFECYLAINQNPTTENTGAGCGTEEMKFLKTWQTGRGARIQEFLWNITSPFYRARDAYRENRQTGSPWDYAAGGI